MGRTSNASFGSSLSDIKTTTQTEAAEADGGADEEAISLQHKLVTGEERKTLRQKAEKKVTNRWLKSS